MRTVLIYKIPSFERRAAARTIAPMQTNVLEATREMLPLITRHRGDTESTRRIAPPVVEAHTQGATGSPRNSSRTARPRTAHSRRARRCTNCSRGLKPRWAGSSGTTRCRVSGDGSFGLPRARKSSAIPTGSTRAQPGRAARRSSKAMAIASPGAGRWSRVASCPNGWRCAAWSKRTASRACCSRMFPRLA